jgi:hypothetical protein
MPEGHTESRPEEIQPQEHRPALVLEATAIETAVLERVMQGVGACGDRENTGEQTERSGKISSSASRGLHALR